MSSDSSEEHGFEAIIPTVYSGSKSPHKKNPNNKNDSSNSDNDHDNNNDSDSDSIDEKQLQESSSENSSEVSEEDDEFKQPKRGRGRAATKASQPVRPAAKKAPAKKAPAKKASTPAAKIFKTTTNSNITPVRIVRKNNVSYNDSDCPTSIHKPLHETLKLFSPKVGLSRRISADGETGSLLLGGRLRQGLSKLSKPREPLHKPT